MRQWLTRALQGKGEKGRRTALANHCGVKPQAVSGWLKTGRITKRNLELATQFFGHGPSFTQLGIPAREAVPPTRPASNRVQAGPVLSPSPPPIHNRNFADRREVSETDWSVLQAVKLVLPDSELERIKTEAERIRRTAAEQIDAAKGG